MARVRGQAGFTIVETMVAATILMIGLLGTLAMLDAVGKRSRSAGNRQMGVGIARDVVEAARQLPFRQLENGTIVPRLQENDNLRGNGNPNSWQISRAKETFTVRATVCAVDDPADGMGARTGAQFCPDVGAAGATDANPMDYKLVTATVSWSEGSGSKSIEEHVLVSSGGRDRPGVETLDMTSPASDVITSPAVTRATFSATTNITADAVVWSVEGAQQGSAAGDGRTWSFSWILPSVDGAYEVSAQAVDASGNSGETRSLTVTLNRYPPSAPEDFVAGRNGSVVEAEWTPNAERDVIGYRVYREAQLGAVELACPLTKPEAGECVDPSPPPADNHWLRYWVVAVDRDPAGGEREGPASAWMNANQGPGPQPAPPTDFAITEDDEGNVTLTWTPSADADTYRIYRDGVTVGDRYARVDPEEPEFDDAAPGIEPHQYWITAVDEFLQESILVGPVTLALPESEPVCQDPANPDPANPAPLCPDAVTSDPTSPDPVSP